MDKKAQQGFTLYELLVTVMVAGVIIGFGLPNLRQFQLNNRMVAASNDMLAVLSMARTEAIKRKTNVTVCTVNPADGNGNINCSNAFPWHQSWMAFVDEDGDLRFDAADDEILRRAGRISGNDADPNDANNIKIASNNNAYYFSFRATGFGRGAVGAAGDPLAAAYIYDSRGNQGIAGGVSTARIVTITAAGRAQVIRDPALISTVCADTANNLTCPIL
ncbi:MAG: GspH/FimT family pseudopilin [Pseudomonadota bacterium]